ATPAAVTKSTSQTAAPPVQKSPPAPAAPVAAAPAANAGVGFDGDWLALMSEIKLGGMAGMLAQHSELMSFEGRKFELVVPEAHKHLAEKSYQDKLKAALDAHFGASVMLKISVGETSGNSVAVTAEREQQTKQNNAIAAIEQDPFVRELVENMDARLIESSIKPI
ncbi:MAG: DNA polymerase III subunit gamma/tau C-terminal domain-containing protein, partial [Burkholderiales bacterium]